MKSIPYYAIVVAMACLSACTGNRQGGSSPSGEHDGDSVPATEPVAAETDTLIGYIGDGTSMHNLEFLPLEGDTMEFELSDDVDRRAELIVGHLVAVVLRHDAGGEPVVTATLDTSEVHNMPYVDMAVPCE